MTQHKTCMIYCQGVISVMKNKEEWKARGAVGEKENLFPMVGGDRWKAAGMNWLSIHMGSYDYHVNSIFLYFVGNMVYYAYHAIYSTTIFLFLFFFYCHEQVFVHILAYTKLFCLQIHFSGSSFWGRCMCPTWFLTLSYLVLWGARRWGVWTGCKAPLVSRLLRINVFTCFPAGPARM